MIDWQKPTCLVFISLTLLCGCGDGSQSGNPASDGSASVPQTDNVVADGSTTGTADDTSNGKTVYSTRGDKPLFDGWPTPAVALVLTGQRRGYLDPCGCT